MDIHVNRPNGEGNSHEIMLEGAARNGHNFDQTVELIFPDFIFPIDKLPDVFEEEEFRYVCKFAVNPETSTLYITAVSNALDENMYTNFHETCNIDDVRPDGTEGCGNRIEDCICNHPDGPIRTKTWQEFNSKISIDDCMFRKFEGFIYLAISRKCLDLLVSPPNHFIIEINDIESRKIESRS